MDDKNGKWVTINGTHIFIKDGQTLEEAMADFDNEKDELDSDTDSEGITTEEIDKEIKLSQEKEFKETCLKSFKGIWDAPYATIKNYWKESLMQHKIIDKELEDAIFKKVKEKKSLKKLWINTKLRDGCYYNGYSRDMCLEVTGNRYKDTETMFHELGHMLDDTGENNEFISERGAAKHYSSSYISKKHNMTLSDMLYKEMHECDIQGLIDEYFNFGKLEDENYAKFNRNEITKDERQYFKAKSYYGTYLSICDIIQGSYGLDYCREKLRNFTHPAGYFDWYSDKYPKEAKERRDKNRGTEFFAEMTSDLCFNDDHELLNTMKKYTPKTIEIYFEILEEHYGYRSK